MMMYYFSLKRVLNGNGHLVAMTSSVCNGRCSNDSSYRSGLYTL